MSEIQKLFVVLDTNVWVDETLLLQTPVARSLLFALKVSGGMLGLPEILEKEISTRVIEYGLEKAKGIRDWNRVQTLLGQYEAPIPSDDLFKEIAVNRFRKLDDLLERVPFSWEQAKQATHDVLEQIPPNSEKNQQFKDSAIWAGIVELSHRGMVHFVTRDHGFFSDRKPNNGLAEPLRSRIDDLNVTIEVYDDLKKYLEKILKPVDVSVDLAKLAEAVSDVFHRFAGSSGIRLEDFKTSVGKSTSEAFPLSETHRDASIQFSIRRRALLPTDEEAFVEVNGNCRLELDSGQISEVKADSVIVVDDEGRRLQAYGRLLFSRTTESFGLATGLDDRHRAIYGPSIVEPLLPPD